MDFLIEGFLEGILGALVEKIVESWTNFMKKRNPEYSNNRFKKAIVLFITIIFMLLIAAVILAFFLLIV